MSDERWRRNDSGQRLEKAGRFNDAIAQYESNVAAKCDTPFSYRRLAILYRKLGQQEDERRVLKSAIRFGFPRKHHDWFSSRMEKLPE